MGEHSEDTNVSVGEIPRYKNGEKNKTKQKKTKEKKIKFNSYAIYIKYQNQKVKDELVPRITTGFDKMGFKFTFKSHESGTISKIDG